MWLVLYWFSIFYSAFCILYRDGWRFLFIYLNVRPHTHTQHTHNRKKRLRLIYSDIIIIIIINYYYDYWIGLDWLLLSSSYLFNWFVAVSLSYSQPQLLFISLPTPHCQMANGNGNYQSSCR